MRRLLSAIFAIFIYTALTAGPARPDGILLYQPDGSSFYALLSGDEFMKIKTTASGESIVQGEDGWWYYAEYDAQGFKVSTGCRVGDNVQVPPESRNIPYDLLSRYANEKRRKAHLARIQRTAGRVCLQTEMPEQKSKAGLVILAQFNGKDEKFKTTKQQFVSMLTKEGYSEGGATGSAKEYFDQQFNGRYDFSFDVTDIVTVKENRAYYGGNTSRGDDKHPEDMVIEACKLVDDKVDFSKYDQDGDGEVDNVFVFFAGLDEASNASSDHIWSHAWFIKDGAGVTLKLDGVLINRYACAAELEGSRYDSAYMTGIGTFCHEYSHTLGLPDLYDADYEEGGYAAALWTNTSLMDGGNYNNKGNTPPYFNAVEREILSLSDPVVIDKAGTYELLPINNGTYYRINTTTTNEYFLIEYRDGSGWDKHIGGSGVLVYHIDKSTKNSGNSYLSGTDIPAYARWENQIEVNALAEHQCADLIEADGRKDIFTSQSNPEYLSLRQSRKGLFFPCNGVESLSPSSTPGLICWGETAIGLAITDISVQNGKATFNVVEFSGETMPVPINIKKDIFQDSAILTFQSQFEFTGSAKVVYGPTGGSTKTEYAELCEPGKWAVELKGLKPTTSYSVTISFMSGGVAGRSVKTSFMTKKRDEAGLPYICLSGSERNPDGTFKSGAQLPLKVFNAADAKEIYWKYNGTMITPGKNLYYKVTHPGTLEANIIWKDGSEDVIIKEVRIADR